MELVSVIMGVHNEKEEYLRVAIESIINQTYKNIEFIVIDDASDDICRHILNEYDEIYESIHVIHNQTNQGLTKSLNEGLKQAKGCFIARMDADDYSNPDRIRKQVEYLSHNPDIDICGTGVVSFGETTMFMSPYKGLSNTGAQCSLFFSSTLCHPSVMMRKDFLDRYNLCYDEKVLKGQDYDMWERCSVVGKIAVMKDVLLFYRTHPSQITSTHKKDQDHYADITRLRRLSRIGVIPTEKEYRCHLLLAAGVDASISSNDVQSWVKKLISLNNEREFVSKEAFANNLNYRLFMYHIRNKHYLCLCHYKDIVRCIRMVFSRFQMRCLLKKEIRVLHNLMADV